MSLAAKDRDKNIGPYVLSSMSKAFLTPGQPLDAYMDHGVCSALLEILSSNFISRRYLVLHSFKTEECVHVRYLSERSSRQEVFET